MRRTCAVLLLLALPDAVDACAVCGAAADRNNAAFIAITILLSLLPLAMIGAGLWWVARQAGPSLADELAESEIGARAHGRPAGGGQG